MRIVALVCARVVERLLLGLFWIVRSACLAQGLAFATALLATPWLGRADTPPWLESAVRSSLWLGATLFLTGVLVILARRLPPPRADDAAEPTWPWPWLLGIALAALPVLAYAGASPLVPLWREILGLLDQIGFWESLEQSGPNSGLLVLPVLAALFVPALESVAAFFLIAPPLGLLVLLMARSRLFPQLFAMTIASQAGLVLAGLIAADAFSRLAAEAIAAMAAAPDAEVHRVAEDLQRAQGVLVSVAAACVAPLLGYLVGAIALWLARGADAFFTEGAPDSRPAPEHPQAAAPSRTTEQRARSALVALGALLLAFSAAEALRSRARYASSDPEPGAALEAPPAAVRVSFARALDPSSTLSVTRSAPGAAATEVATSTGLDPGDPQRRTLRAELSGAPDGLYRATWRSLPASGGVARHGSFTFAVAMPAPDSSAGSPLEERDAGERRRRHTLLGGVGLVAFGALWPRRR